MSSDVAKSPAKSNPDEKPLKSSLPKGANNEKNVTNGHSENLPTENLSSTKIADNAETSSNSAKDKHKTSKSNKTSKKEDSKSNQKSDKNDTNDQKTPATPTKGKKDKIESEASEKTSENTVNNRDVISDINSSHTASTDNEPADQLPEKKVVEDNNIDANTVETSEIKTDESTEVIEGSQPEENVATTDNHNTNIDEEMPSFTLDPEPDIEETKPRGKILKYKSPPLVEKPKASDKSKRKKKAVKETAKQIEIAVEKPADAVMEPVRRPPSFGHISGRRSFRTLPDLPARRYHYEAPKITRNDLDTTSSSLNVTVGSELAVDSSFSFFGFGKKREYTESVDTQSSKGETEETAKTPKRARLDRSGILNLITTPISLLRSQFSKTSMLCSTPNTDARKADEDGVENVSVVDAEEILIQKAPIDENIVELKNDLKDGKCLDEMADDALQVQMQLEDNQPEVKRKGCNVM